MAQGSQVVHRAGGCYCKFKFQVEPMQKTSITDQLSYETIYAAEGGHSSMVIYNRRNASESTRETNFPVRKWIGKILPGPTPNCIIEAI